jgi:hypothetical protein
MFAVGEKRKKKPARASRLFTTVRMSGSIGNLSISDLGKDLDATAESGGAYMSEQTSTVFCVYAKKSMQPPAVSAGSPSHDAVERRVRGIQSAAPLPDEYHTPESAIKFILHLFKSKDSKSSNSKSAKPTTDFDAATKVTVCQTDTNAYGASNTEVLKMLLDSAYELGIHSVPKINELALAVLNIQYVDVTNNGEPQVTGTFKFGTREARFSIMPPSAVTRTIVIIIWAAMTTGPELKVTVTVKW